MFFPEIDPIMIEAVIQAVISGIIGGTITGVAAIAAIKVEIRWMRDTIATMKEDIKSVHDRMDRHVEINHLRPMRGRDDL